MSTAQMGLNHRRRVVFSALRQLFADADQVKRYFLLWDREFSHDAHFVVTRFTARVSQLANLDDADKSKFLRALYVGISQPLSLLPRYPEDWVALAEPATAPALAAAAQAPAAAPVVRSYVDPETTVLRTVLSELSAGIRQKMQGRPDELRRFARDIFAESVKRPGLLSTLGLWADSGLADSALGSVRGIEDMRSAVHAVYLVCADFVGPMQADRLLSAGVDKARTIPEAANFSPEQLL